MNCLYFKNDDASFLLDDIDDSKPKIIDSIDKMPKNGSGSKVGQYFSEKLIDFVNHTRLSEQTTTG